MQFKYTSRVTLFLSYSKPAFFYNAGFSRLGRRLSAPSLTLWVFIQFAMRIGSAWREWTVDFILPRDNPRAHFLVPVYLFIGLFSGSHLFIPQLWRQKTLELLSTDFLLTWVYTWAAINICTKLCCLKSCCFTSLWNWPSTVVLWGTYFYRSFNRWRNGGLITCLRLYT